MHHEMLTEIINLPTTRGWANNSENKIIYDWVFEQTSHLPKRAQLIQRAWTMLNGDPKCVECGRKVSTWNPKDRAYAKFCSAACSRAHNQRITTDILPLSEVAKWCMDNSLMSGLPYHKNPSVAHSILHHTKWLPESTPATQRKYHILSGIHSIPTCKLCDNEVSWCGEGDTHYYNFCSTRCSNKHEDVVAAKVATCIDRFGVDYKTVLKDKARSSIQANYENRISTAQRHIPLDVLDKLNDPDWLTAKHHIDRQTLTSISDELNVDKQTVINYMSKHGIDVKRFGSSQPERDICALVESWGVDVVQNDRLVLKGLELDIYIPEAKLAIEYCGLYWHADIHDRIDRNYHVNKLDKCNNAGIRLITIFEDEWVHHREKVIDKLKSFLHLGQGNRVFARKTTVVDVTKSDAKTFHNNHHIQGYGSSTKSYGLVDGGSLVAVVSFKRKSGDDWYLTRYSTIGSVVGGFQKLLKHFECNVEYSSITTFADRRWSEGALYYNSGFDMVDTLDPDYSYIRGTTRIHKFNYRRKYLPKLLETFDPELSERENCDINGVLRIWNCGLLKFVKLKKGCI